MAIEFQALGGLSVTHDRSDVAIGGRRQRRLLSMLLIHRNSVVSTDRLTDVVFDGDPTPGADTTLRSYIARIRKVVEVEGSTARVVTKAPGYMLTIADDSFDVDRFERLTAAARGHVGRDDGNAATLLREAMGLWRGGPYAEFDDEEWAQPEAQRLAEVRVVALETLFAAELGRGRDGELVPEIEALVREQPLRETPRSQLMLALYRSGRQADALRQFGDYRSLMIDELGLDPSAELRDLEARMLAQDPTLAREATSHPLRGYRLGGRLGTGRDGTVQAATLPGVERDYVVRTFRPEIADSPEFVRNFEATALRVAALDHPAIVTIHDYWREPGAAFVVMRRMHGGTLADRLARAPMSRPAGEALIERIGGALRAAHDAGLVHRRITTRNVLFDANDDAYLTDFSLGQPGGSGTASDDMRDFEALIAHAGIEVGDATADSPAPAINPYKGLRAFDEVDAVDFFGRDDVVDELLTRLARDDVQGRLALLVAGSGTGKSSIVRAGLLPRVRRGAVPGSSDWFVTTMVPSAAPFDELSESLRRISIAGTDRDSAQLSAPGGIDTAIRDVVPDDGQLLLVIDQFEELFTLAGERDQGAFVQGLMDAIEAPDSRLRVVATLRADFFDRPLAFHRLGTVLSDSTIAVAAMSPAQLEAAIVEPAARVGRGVEGALVAEIVSAVVDQPAALPSLQFALYELAARCDGTLTLAAYRQLGGVQGAIASRAESLHAALDDSDRDAVRTLFEQLVALTADGEPTRRRAKRSELVGESTGQLVEAWTSARLLTADRDPETRVPTVEVAHEALLREWPRLRGWIEEDRDELVVLGHLRESANAWEAIDRDPGALYRGARLQAAIDVVGRDGHQVNAIAREFLEASTAGRDAEVVAESERRRRQARANKRLRIELVAIGAALVIALVGGFVAVRQRRTAEQQRRVANARELAAAADANLSEDPQLSILLALQAIDATRDGDGTVLTEATDALHGAITSSRILHEFKGLGGSLDWSPDGKMFVTEGPENSGLVDIRDASTGKTVRAWVGHTIDINDVAFGPDGTTVATTGDDGALRVWDVATGALIAEFVSAGSVWSPAFSPDGSTVAAAWVDQAAVRAYDIASGKQLAQIPSRQPFGVSFNNDGSLLAFGDTTGPVSTIVSIATGDVLQQVGSGDGSIYDVAFSPDGTRLATTGADTNVRIWDVTTGDLLDTIAADHGAVETLDWSPDGTRIATASDDGTARVFDVDAAGRQLVSVSDAETQQGLVGLAFSPDGNRLMTADGNMTAVKIWDVSAEAGAEWLSVPIAPASPGGGFVDGGRAVVASDGNGTAASWDVTSGKQMHEFAPSTERGDGRGGLAVSADGSVIATSGDPSYPVVAWDVKTGKQLFSYSPGDSDMVMGLQWSADGQRLAVAETPQGGGRITILDRAGNVVVKLHDDTNVFTDTMAFSPDDRTLVAHLIRNPSPAATRVWDLTTGRKVVDLSTSAQALAVDPSGASILISGFPSTDLEVWDATTMQKVRSVRTPASEMNVAYSPDGKLVTASGIDGVVRVWDTATWTQRASLRGHATFARTVAFSPDGSELLSVGDDGVARVWALDLDELVTIAESRLTRGFTDDECVRYLHLDRCQAPSG